jgi:DNA-binding HxlR family transcriptional regulator
MTETPVKPALRSRDAIELLSDKWRIAVLHLLTTGALRTNQLHRSIRDVSAEEVSAKVLTQTLRRMERDGLVERRVLAEAPPHVEYRLTPMGRSVVEPLRELCHWAQAHVEERDAARQRYDAANRRGAKAGRA